MIDAINEVNATSPLNYVPTVHHTAAASSDAVVLSETAQAKLLEQNGMSVAEIADQLGINTSTVLGELGIAITSSQPSGNSP